MSAVSMATANGPDQSPVNRNTNANYAKLTILRYLYGLSELEVEGNDAHALQPGGEAGPPTPAVRILTKERTGTVKRVHHRNPRPASGRAVIPRPSIPKDGTQSWERKTGGRQRGGTGAPWRSNIAGVAQTSSVCADPVRPIRSGATTL